MKSERETEIDTALARVLGRTDEIAPSSGFAGSVMDAVRREAAAPEPIPFPWKWTLPGLVLCLGLIGYLLVSLVQQGARAVSDGVTSLHIENLAALLPRGMIEPQIGFGVEWSVAAMLASLAIVWLTMRMVTGRE